MIYLRKYVERYMEKELIAIIIIPKDLAMANGKMV